MVRYARRGAALIRSPKKPIDIELFVRWAFRDELPKAQAETTFLRPDTFSKPWGGILKTGMLGTEIQEPDIRNRYGLVPDFTAQAEPHPDAVRLWRAVTRLAAMTLELPDDWNPLSDFGDLGPEGPAAVQRGLAQISFMSVDGIRHLKDSYAPGYLVRRSAIMAPPDWTFDKPERKYVNYSWGQPRWFMMQPVATETGSFEVEVDGFDNVIRRPRDGAYRKTYLDPDPIEAVTARAEYEIWHTCLGILAEDLTGRLDEHEATDSARPARPWEVVGTKAPRVLADLTKRKPYRREARPLAGPPPYRGIGRKKDAAE